MLLQWYIGVVTAISRYPGSYEQYPAHNFRLLGCKEILGFGLTQMIPRLLRKQ